MDTNLLKIVIKKQCAYGVAARVREGKLCTPWVVLELWGVRSDLSWTPLAICIDVYKIPDAIMCLSHTLVVVFQKKGPAYSTVDKLVLDAPRSAQALRGVLLHCCFVPLSI